VGYGQSGSGKTHLMDTAYSKDGVTGVKLRAISYIFYSQRNGELGLENYGIICGGKLNVIL
jgi:ABC-type lipoprotein export system ATPase subunit